MLRVSLGARLLTVQFIMKNYRKAKKVSNYQKWSSLEVDLYVNNVSDNFSHFQRVAY